MLNMRAEIGGAPVEIVGVAPGDHTLCIIPGMPDSSGKPGPLKCQAVKVGAGPTQAVAVTVPAAIIAKP
jgi:hypothetical protein